MKRYYNIKTLEDHLPYHTGLMPYHCSVCTEQFPTLALINKHLGKQHQLSKNLYKSVRKYTRHECNIVKPMEKGVPDKALSERCQQLLTLIKKNEDSRKQETDYSMEEDTLRKMLDEARKKTSVKGEGDFNKTMKEKRSEISKMDVREVFDNFEVREVLGNIQQKSDRHVSFVAMAHSDKALGTCTAPADTSITSVKQLVRADSYDSYEFVKNLVSELNSQFGFSANTDDEANIDPEAMKVIVDPTFAVEKVEDDSEGCEDGASELEDAGEDQVAENCDKKAMVYVIGDESLHGGYAILQ